MDGAERKRVEGYYDYNKKPPSSAARALKSIDAGLYLLWNIKQRKWTVKQKVSGPHYTVGHFHSVSQAIQDCRRRKHFKNQLRPGDLERSDCYEAEEAETEKKEIIDRNVNEHVDRIFYDKGHQSVTPMVVIGGGRHK